MQDEKQICMDCSKRFHKGVAEKEHDQREYYLCPVTNVYAKETDLSRICPHCNQKVGDGHKQGEKRPCPSKPAEMDGIKKHRHLTFSVQTMSGPKRFEILFKKDEWSLDDQFLSQLKAKYEAKRRKQPALQPKRALDEAKLLAAVNSCAKSPAQIT